MSSVRSVQDELLDRLYDIDAEEFEQFSKIFVETIERPDHIELTPFGGDGGIDVRGNVGTELYNPRFGVQTKQFRNNVGQPAVRNFVGALRQHHYQWGVFITTADYSNGAVELAEDQQDQPITLVNRDRLLDLMLATELGAVEIGEDTYEVDEDFWEIFERTESDAPVSSEEVPQADSFDVMQYALQAVDRGYRYKAEVTQYLERKTGDDWAQRQADYYLVAAWALGYTHKDRMGEYNGHEMRQWGLTRDGQEYVELIDRGLDEEAEQHLAEHIEQMEIVERLLPEIKDKGSISHQRLIDFIEEESELRGTTPGRRASTVGVWIDTLPYITRKHSGSSYRYEYIPSRIDEY